jgi:Na+/H+-dicarboxylate symporter
MVLTSVGLPIEGIGLVAGIDAVLDAMRTCVNVTGDTAVCAVIAATEGETLSPERARPAS